MKRSERLMFLAGVLCAACAVTFGVVRTKEQKEKIKNSDAVILTIPADTVTALSWETGTENLSFHKEEMWTYDEDAAFPVDEEKIGELLEIFEEFGVSFVIEDVEITASTAWMIQKVPSAWRRERKAMKFSWVISAPWIRSGMCPLETATPIW